MERVKSSDVLDATHEVRVGFRAIVLGYFRRTGPNSWDDYEFVLRVASPVTRPAGDQSSGELEFISVLPLVPVQLEARGVDVRLRSEGKVVRARFVPSEADVETITLSLGRAFEPKQDFRALRQHFLASCLRSVGGDSPKGISAVIVGKLNEK
jgi:hypothetical protein